MPRLLLALIVALAWTVPCRGQAGSAPASVEAFKAEPVFWKQADIGEALVARGDRSVLGALEGWLAHEDRHIRANVAFVFASFGDPRGLRTLEAIAKDRTPRPWGQGVPTAPSNMSEGWQLRPTAAQTKSDRYYAVHVLGALRDKGALRTLLPLLRDPDIDYKVAWALGEIGDRSATPNLVQLLEHPDGLYRVIAVNALAKLGAVDAVPALRMLTRDDAVTNEGMVSRKALEAMAYLESLDESSPPAADKVGFQPPRTVQFLTVEELVAKATSAGCRITGSWWCRVGCFAGVGRINQQVRIEPDLSALLAVPQATVIAELGIDDTGRVRDACMLRGIRPDVDREVIRAMTKWRFEPARVRQGPEAGTAVWPVITVTASVGSPQPQ